MFTPMLNPKRKLIPTLLAAALLAGCQPSNYVDSTGRVSVTSPDGKIQFTLRGNGALVYSVSVDGKPVLSESRLGLKFRDGLPLGANARLVKAQKTESDTTWENPLGKRRIVRDRHRELRASFVEGSGRPFEIVVRVFNDGLGFRYVLPAAPSGAPDFILEEEQTRFRFPADYFCYAGFSGEGGFKGSQESEFHRVRLSELPTDKVRLLPLLVETPAAWVAITESDLFDWAGLWLSRAASAADKPGSVTLAARLAPRLDGHGLVKSAFPRQSPWRTLLIARQPGQLIESDLVNNLASPNRLKDSSWIRPGKMAWDHWWSGDVKMDTATLKEYVQLAADMGWPYQLVDWQWYGPYDKPDASITNINPAVDLEELRRFAKEKGVRLWLWLYWTDVDRNDAWKQAFALYEKWGIAGVKIDFMDRDDQEMVNWYETLTTAAADHHLMINFHGAYKPTGMIRTYRNQVTREGILGNEYNRWSARVTPEHKLTLPFTRFLAGPGDYTPGGFLNRQPEQFKPDPKAAKVQGTRAAELALFVLYDSPVCCVCDHPRNYHQQPGVDLLKVVPTVWDDTRVLNAAVGQQLVMARRSGERWFLGALTDRNARDLSVKLDFLAKGLWKAKIWRDAPDSDTAAEHLVAEERTVSAADTLNLHLARSGGAVVQFQIAK